MPLTEEELAREKKFIRSERAKAFQAKPRFERTTAERVERIMEKLPEDVAPSAEYVPIIERREPANDCKTVYPSDDTICVECPVDIVRVNVETKEERIVGFDVERDCVSFPVTRRCIEAIGESKARKGEFFAGKECDLVKTAYACVDREESAGGLTKKQVAGLTKLSEADAERCITKLVREDLLKPPTTGTRTWAGGDYYMMPKEKQQKIKDDLAR